MNGNKFVFYVGDDMKALYYRLHKIRDSSFTKAMTAPGLSQWLRNHRDELYDTSEPEFEQTLFELTLKYVKQNISDGTFYKVPYQKRRRLINAINSMSLDMFGDSKAWEKL